MRLARVFSRQHLAIAVITVLVMIAGCLIYKRYGLLLLAIWSLASPPADLVETRIILGKELLERQTFIETKELAQISSLKYGKFNSDTHLKLIIAGQRGAIVATESGVPERLIRFAREPRLDVEVINAEGDCLCEFFARNPSLIGAELLDRNGNSIWVYNDADNKTSFLNDIAAGDVSDVGKAEYVAAYKHSKGLVLLDHSLKVKWQRSDISAEHVELMDLAGNTRIVASSWDRILIIDHEGSIVTSLRTDQYVGYFSLVRLPLDGLYVATLDDDKIWLIGLENNGNRIYPAPLSSDLDRVHTVPVKIRKNESEYFAAVAESAAFDRSVFYLYDSLRAIVYQEVMPEAITSIATMPSTKTPGTDAILLGGNGRVLKLEARP